MPLFLLLLMSEFKVRFSARSAIKVNARVGWIVIVLLHRCVRREICDSSGIWIFHKNQQISPNIAAIQSIYLFIQKVSRLYE